MNIFTTGKFENSLFPIFFFFTIYVNLIYDGRKTRKVAYVMRRGTANGFYGNRCYTDSQGHTIDRIHTTRPTTLCTSSSSSLLCSPNRLFSSARYVSIQKHTKGAFLLPVTYPYPLPRRRLHPCHHPSTTNKWD